MKSAKYISFSMAVVLLLIIGQFPIGNVLLEKFWAVMPGLFHGCRGWGLCVRVLLLQVLFGCIADYGGQYLGEPAGWVCLVL